MKILNLTFKTIMITGLMVLGSCQPDEIHVNTGPVFLGGVTASGTDRATGLPIAMPVDDNESKIPVDAVITIDFSKALDAEATLAATSIMQEGNAVDASIIVEGQSIIITPSADLAFGTKYTITLGSGIKGEDGGLVLGPVTRSFTTEVLEPSVYDGVIFHMSFDGDFAESVSETNATVVGTPGFTDGLMGDAYAGATNGYLTFPTAGLLGEEFSAVFWLKIDATPDRAGVLVIGPPDPLLPATPNNRNAGFRFFREADSGNQRFKLNVGSGAADHWFDGGTAADVNPTTNEWVHFAFTISGTEAVVYIDGEVVSQGTFPGVSWTGCDVLSIMSGVPRFTEWGHLSDESSMDELRIFNRVLAQEDIQAIIQKESGYDEVFYLPFDGNFTERLSNTSGTEVGSPDFAGEALHGKNSYSGAADSYLTFPTDGLKNEEFSASFWLKINAVPDRAGILVMGPPDPNLPATPNNRNFGFRFFREDAGGMQRFKLNVGNGTADSWFDGGAAADVDPTANEWVHFAFTISDTECVVYINGDVVSQGAFTGVDWTGCDVLSIMSGVPRFMEWGHLSDLSYMDELRIFDRVLTETEVETIIDDQN